MQITYAFHEFVPADFPIKIDVRSLKNYNRQVHAHDNLQLCYIAAGSCTHWIQGKQAAVVKGDFFAVPPFLEHQITPRDNMDFTMYQIDFIPYLINEKMRELSSMDDFVDFAYLQPLVTVEEEILPKLQFTPEKQRQVESLIDSMREELQSREDGYRLSVKADLLKLLVIAGREYRQYRKGNKPYKTISYHRQAFYKAITYIEQHYAEDLRLEDMAVIAHMAPSYFSSLFKLIKGATFIEYLNDLRIHQAMELLLTTDTSITEIGFKVGYNNIGHFNKMFKKVTGITPSEYRKQAARHPL